MESHGEGIGSHAVVVPLIVARLSSEKDDIAAIKTDKRRRKITCYVFPL